ncbi:hypothetical protein ACFYTQ_15385 [Nocardia sp. NPDC004068]|uniref:hypothetical protein n=1 Tax=Nocardia sp. NPDC004068 TaxID=3364303 RepID=UPI0036A4A616
MTMEHHTECDGFRVRWRRDHQRQQITVLAIDRLEDGPEIVAVLGSGDPPDLVEARERWPQLSRLWDAVRHDFWTRGPAVPTEHEF